ncbi:DUF5343 domain-containing protein [Sulfuriferula sp.]|uniref:DUF5343 domain-containing protein n=1 Tax=Sulfuriferula sp. TaxID=2025307 RepID=UPI0027320DCA|nr:DUF5343 domain-containing protein [Sulfuriferula sp.]MDP2027116.1 DUF5343 domain-containing protein [Sulfuriferula sp.]
MADTHPYISGAGNVAQMIARLRKAFPASISAETVKKHGLAPNNESYVINALQFIGVIDAEGKKTPEAAKVFSHQNDDQFALGFGELVKKAYSSLFELHGEHAWALDNGGLVTFFRQSDQTSEIIGKRQAGTFRVLAGLSGHGDLPETKTPKSPKAAKPATTVKQKQKRPYELSQKEQVSDTKSPIGLSSGSPLGLTVRVEINLPADGSKETYDNIFKSIKENLLGG